MKFKEKVCGNCGLDLTTIEPVRVREIDETVTLGECPNCHTNRIMVAPELKVIEPAPEPEPAPKPEPAPEPVAEE